MSSGELECLVEQISNVLEECPLYYVIEVLEMAQQYRDRMGEQDELDISSDEEEDPEDKPEFTDEEDEEDKSSGSESDG